MPETFYEPIKEPPSLVLTTVVIGEYINSDPLARGSTSGFPTNEPRFVNHIVNHHHDSTDDQQASPTPRQRAQDQGQAAIQLSGAGAGSRVQG